MKKLIFLLLTIILFNGCSNDDDKINDIQYENFNLHTDTNTVIPMQFVIISSNDLVFNSNRYSATFGNIDVELILNEDGNLIFNVPEISSGNHQLELIIDNFKSSLTFYVGINEVKDFSQTLQNEVILPLNNYQSSITELIDSQEYSGELLEQIQTADQILSDLFLKLNSISNNEKLEIAKFFNANPFFTSDFLNLASKTLGNTDYDCFNRNSLIVVRTTITMVAFVAILPKITAGLSLAIVPALTVLISGTVAAAVLTSVAHEKLYNECVIPLKNKLFDKFFNSNNFEVSNNVSTNFNIKSYVRSLISTDDSSENNLISTTVEAMNKIKSIWKPIKDGINSAITETSNWFTNWLKPSSGKYKPITYDIKELPDSRQEIESDGDSEFITIDGFPSDINVEVNVATDNSIDLKIIADESSLPRTVSGKIKYNDGDFTTEDEFSVTINILDFELTGTWRLIHYIDDTRSELSQSDYIDFQNGASDIGLPQYIVYHTTGNTSDTTGSVATWNQSFNNSTSKLSLTNNYWTNIEYRFDYNPNDPNKLIGKCIGSCDQGYNLELIKQ